jgi:prepilin-type N-terminal cleavage/methylation domain-containing protein
MMVLGRRREDHQPVSSGCEASRLAGAFTLTEVLVATALLAIVAVSLYAGIAAGFAGVQMSRENLRGTQIMLEKFETIRLYSWDQITSTNFIPTTFTAPFQPNGATNSGIVYTGTVTITSPTMTEAYSNDMRMVNINVTWNSGNLQRNRSMSSYVSRYGLQNYVYY